MFQLRYRKGQMLEKGIGNIQNMPKYLLLYRLLDGCAAPAYLNQQTFTRIEQKMPINFNEIIPKLT